MVLSDLGATLVKLLVPAKDGSVKDVVLGYDTPQEYIDNTCYFGTVIGRSGNRIANGRFMINGKTYQLGINDNDNNLHSGPDGYDNRKWDVKAVDEEKNSVTTFAAQSGRRSGLSGGRHPLRDLYAERGR